MHYRQKHINPKIRNLRPKQIFFKKPLFWVIFTGIVLLAILYFALFWQKLQIQEIQILGNEKIQTEEIKNIAQTQISRKLFNAGLFSVSSKSILTLDKKGLTQNIFTLFPGIKEVVVEKKYPQSVILTVKERKPFAAFCQSLEECFLMDEEGVIFEVLQYIPEGMFIISSTDDKEIALGQTVIEKNIIKSVAKIKEDLENNFQLGIGEVLVSSPLIVKTSENWRIYFDKDLDMNAQIAKMNALLKDEIPQGTRKNLEYIYLQYKDRAYYK